MRRLLLILASVGLLVAVPVANPQSQAAQKAKLQLVDVDPIVLRGQRFRALERVKLTLIAGAAHRVRWVRASRAGAFVARFADVPADRCSQGVGVTAVGARGSRAAIAAKRPAPDCPPPLDRP